MISIITSTGFTTASFADWPSFLPLLLIYISFIGGCAGSTAGGIKVVSVVNVIWGFFAMYALSTATLTLAMVWTGLDVLSAFSAVAACINVLGPGLGEVAGNFATVSPAGKWILVFAMLLGRLEIFTLFVLLTPAFWTR